MVSRGLIHLRLVSLIHRIERPVLVGYVSDERFLTVPNASFEFERDGTVTTALSTASGAVRFGDLAAFRVHSPEAFKPQAVGIMVTRRNTCV